MALTIPKLYASGFFVYTEKEVRKMISCPDYDNCIERLPCIEPRAPGLFVKNGREKESETLWEKYYGGDLNC